MSEKNPKYWRTLDERVETLAAQQAAINEFTPGILDNAFPASSVTRRGFLGLVGATAALATAGCTSRERTIVPYTKRPKEIIPGVANYYASTFPEGQRAYPVLVKTREGRPIHVTGNDEHPLVKGKTCPRAVADISALYDPDRVRRPKFEQRPVSWAEADKALGAALVAAKRQGKSVLLISDATNSPSRKALLARLKSSLPTLEHISYEPGVADSQMAGARAAFGMAVHVRPRINEARIILALGADFLNGDDPESIAAFTAQRRPASPVTSMNRLWVFEGPLSLTGANADQRFPVRPSAIAGLAFALARELNEHHGVALPSGVTLPATPDSLLQSQGIPHDAWEKLAADLAAAKNNAVVLCGDAMPAEAQLATHLLNTMLGSTAVEYRPIDACVSLEEIQSVIQGMNSGRYAVAIVWGANPAYAYPRAQQWASSFAMIPTRAFIGLFEDESASQCQWVLPSHHWLESWGDFGERELLSLQQPAISPLYDTRQGEDVILALLRALGSQSPEDYHAFLRHRWQTEVQPPDSPLPFDRFFEAALHDGVLRRDLPSEAVQIALQPTPINDAARRANEKTTGPGLELVLRPGTQVYDGRYANNAWLQELPDPITRNTWGNPVSVSVADARELGIKNGDLAELELGAVRLELAVIVQPGQAKGVLALSLGYGRTKGEVARGVGVNAFPLLGLDSSSPFVREAAKLTEINWPCAPRNDAEPPSNARSRLGALAHIG